MPTEEVRDTIDPAVEVLRCFWDRMIEDLGGCAAVRSEAEAAGERIGDKHAEESIEDLTGVAIDAMSGFRLWETAWLVEGVSK